MRLAAPVWPYLFPGVRRSLAIALVLWLFWGILGVHKLYLGQPILAVAYLFTGGFFGIGWFVDLVTLAPQVAWCNARIEQDERGLDVDRLSRPVLRGAHTAKAIRMRLLEYAQNHGGTITVSEGVLATGTTFEKVERVLSGMVESGYVGVTNHPESGIVQYTFPEFSGHRSAPTERS